jgi:hypothetical protein
MPCKVSVTGIAGVGGGLKVAWLIAKKESVIKVIVNNNFFIQFLLIDLITSYKN